MTSQNNRRQDGGRNAMSIRAAARQTARMRFTGFRATLLALTVSAPLAAAPATYRIDPEHFSIAFLIEHIGYEKLIGQFTLASGEFVYDEQTKQLRAGSVEVRAASVTTHHGPRDSHVRGGDFLDIEKHPFIRFVATTYQSNGDSTGSLRGDLTMLGRTHPVELDVRLNKAAQYPFGHRKHTLGVSVRASLERSRWGMNYGVANGLVGDEVELLIEFEALRQ
jgi:polyisoprenoid-binding protein YceI